MQRGEDLAHVGLIVSAGAAASLRFFSDFSFSTIQHQAALGHLDTGRASLASFGGLLLNSLGYELQRDWFNLSPQALPELVAVLGVLLGLYGALRRPLAPSPAAAAVLLSIPVLSVVATGAACAWILLRSA
jgi:hypothetical protein